jgi:uncharacterized protein with von Willebrand factor type A (vWA) domain
MPVPEHAVIDAGVALGRALRAAGLHAGVDEDLVFCRALAEIDIGSRAEVYWAARGCFVRSPGDLTAFEPVFERFWAGQPLEAGEPIAEHGETDPRMQGPQHGGESLPQFRTDGRSGRLIGGDSRQASREVPGVPGDQDADGRRRGVLAAYSAQEALSDPEPLDFAGDELEAVRRLADELRRRAPERRSRRLRPARRSGRLDVRRTLRRALETEGEPLRPAYAAHSLRPRRLVFLCDVSGSMERYSRQLLAALQGAVAAGIRAEAFVFATRLTRLTGTLADRDIARALEHARAEVPDWSGGTRIGQALAHFNRRYARLGLARGAIVIIASDGWDRGDPDVLARELARLRLQCRRLVWLNPRPHQDPRGQPLAIGMRTALPYVDDFVPGHDPRAVEQLVRVIRGLGEQRPARPQRVLGYGRMKDDARRCSR